MKLGNMNVIVNTTTTRIVWTYHYSQPPNNLGGHHMTQTIHDFVEWENPIRNPPQWSCSGRQWWFKNFLPEMLLGMVLKNSFHFSNTPPKLDIYD